MTTLETDMQELDGLIGQLAEAHERLAKLVERQREGLRRADAGALASAGAAIEAQVRQVAGLESARREACLRLGPRLGLAGGEAAGAKLEQLASRAGGPWAGRLRQSAGRLARQMERVRRAGRVNQTVAGRLAGFVGELLGQLGRLGRETGCYDARGRRSLAREPVGVNCFSAVG